jgi:hypothetical protein
LLYQEKTMASSNMIRHLFSPAGAPMRLFLMNAALVMFIGIWLSGFEQVHWSIYIIPALFSASALFGICPGINLWRLLLGERN